ncbi:MAG: Peptidase [Moraxellaceae bacterium]|nr:Peptidase [Moraxellaceae bacterium]
MVAAGDTLYSIALRYEKDYQELALLNRLDARFTIRPGQRLRLRGSPAPRPPAPPVATRRKPVGPVPTAERNPVTKRQTAQAGGGAPEVRISSPASAALAWTWPAKGPVIGRFGSAGVTGKGLDIGGRRGDSVLAAASGVVVYAGSGLVGYGRLLIIRHDDNYISAYAHNDRFLVSEGERVQPGQAIAEMGASGADREKLHFEIRERGKPVDPQRFLPARD